MSDNHDHPADEERRIREAALDETIAASFPASDPPSTLPNPDEHDAVQTPPSPPPTAIPDRRRSPPEV